MEAVREGGPPGGGEGTLGAKGQDRNKQSICKEAGRKPRWRGCSIGTQGPGEGGVAELEVDGQTVASVILCPTGHSKGFRLCDTMELGEV